MERAEVFEATHRLVLELAASGAVDGLRIDHPDGLADPAGYFLRLQQRYAEHGRPARRRRRRATAAPPELPLYVVVEKIVAPHEQLPQGWAVHGTTGYRFANVVNGLMIDGDARNRLDRVWRAFVRDEAEDFDTLAWRCRQVVMDGTLAGELTVLSANLLRLAREDRRTRDFTLNSLRQALAEVIAAFPVYRTYIVDKPSAQDRRHVDWAIGRRAGAASRPTPACSTSCAACCSAGPCRGRRPASASATASSRAGCSSTPRRWRPRASRTPRCTATTAWSRSTTSAASPTASAPRSRPSTPRASTAR
jgi:maltooligosyltrehalose synthase